MAAPRSASLHAALAKVAPGTALRDGLDRIVRAKMGALLVIGDGPDVLSICSGGFLLDAAFSPQRLSELAKMDGAIIITSDASRIARANVHLVPNPNTPTSETGTRHRTAERVARSIDVPVVSVSEDMGVIAVYVDETKHVLEDIPRLLNRANQALQTLERYKTRLDDVSGTLSALEVQDLVTVRDVALVLQRSEMARRISQEIANYVVELGVDARLIQLQLDELMGDAEDERWSVLQDYCSCPSDPDIDAALAHLSALDTEELLDTHVVGRVLGLGEGEVALDRSVAPRGYRLLAKLHRLPEDVIESVVHRFGSLHRIMRATVNDLDAVAGVDEEGARSIKDGLTRLAETSILDRYS
jgi:diadenylate cyclase